MIVGCYLLHLYCDNPDCSTSGEFTGTTEAEAKKEARQAGWCFIFNRVYCWTCTPELQTHKKV